MQYTVSELLLLARLQLQRAKVHLPYLKARGAQQRFINSVQQAFPHMPDADCRELYLRHRLSMQRLLALRAHLDKLDAPATEFLLTNHVKVEGREYLDLARSSGRPVIFFTPHYGNFPVACMKLIQEIGRSKTINSFYNPPSVNLTAEGFEDLFQRLGYGYAPLFNDEMAALKAIRLLRRGEALTILPDIFDVSGHTIYVPFFGRLMPAMAGTAMFALKSNAIVIGVYGCPEEGLQTTVRLNAPLEIRRSGDLEHDMRSMTAAILRDMERQIRRSPEHWFPLANIGELLADKLRLQTKAGQDWLEQLRRVAPQFQHAVPEWEQTLHELTQRRVGGSLF